MAKHISSTVKSQLADKDYARRSPRRLIGAGIFDKLAALNNLRNSGTDYGKSKTFYLAFKEKKQIPLFIIQNTYFDLQSVYFTRHVNSSHAYQSLYSYTRARQSKDTARQIISNAIDRRVTDYEALHTVMSRMLLNTRFSTSINDKNVFLDLLYKKPEGVFLSPRQAHPARGTYADLAFDLGYVNNNTIGSNLVGFKSGSFEVNFGHLVDVTRQKVLVQFTINEEFLEYYMLSKLMGCPENIIPQIFTIYVDKDFYEGTDGIYSKELLQVVKKGFLNIIDPKIKQVFMEGTSYYSELYSDEIKVPFKANVIATISENATAQEELFKSTLFKEDLSEAGIELID